MPKHLQLESFEIPSVIARGLQLLLWKTRVAHSSCVPPASPIQMPSVSPGIAHGAGDLPFEKQIKPY